jgi:hypothetical protein
MLGCTCNFDFDSYYYPADDFTEFICLRRKRCVSCNSLIKFTADCLQFTCCRIPYSAIEEIIHGDEVPMADKYMCEKCGEIFLNLDAIGYCMNLGADMREELREYWNLTGFKPPQETPCCNTSN